MCKWKLTNEIYEYIKGEVAYIFSHYKIKCMPVSGFEIAIKMGIILRPYSSLPLSKRRAARSTSPDGFYIEYNGGNYIFYNDIEITYERQNWTILHEIGHIALDHTGHSEQEENEANFFAKYAIAPPVLVDKIAPTSPDDIALFFDVSDQEADYAYDYYCTWKKRHTELGNFTSYELIILDCFAQSA